MSTTAAAKRVRKFTANEGGKDTHTHTHTYTHTHTHTHTHIHTQEEKRRQEGRFLSHGELVYF